MFIAEGPKIVGELPVSDIKVEVVYAVEEWIEHSKGKFEYLKAEVNQISTKELERISNLSTPNQVLAVCKIPERDVDEISEEDGTVVMLDGIRDPGNLGTIIRTADWFGVR
ncbi:MAG: RNA methyltransferase, partial [Bacteroidetes bacterium]